MTFIITTTTRTHTTIIIISAIVLLLHAFIIVTATSIRYTITVYFSITAKTTDTTNIITPLFAISITATIILFFSPSLQLHPDLCADWRVLV